MFAFTLKDRAFSVRLVHGIALQTKHGTTYTDFMLHIAH